jgi:hypothetical protein
VRLQYELGSIWLTLLVTRSNEGPSFGTHGEVSSIKLIKMGLAAQIEQYENTNTQFHPMIPSATVKGPDIEPVITDTLRPMIPTSPTPRSSR